jgi:hypothetical protein
VEDAKPDKLSFNFKNVSLADAARSLSDLGGVDMLIAPDVSLDLNVDVVCENVAVTAALKRVVESLGLALEISDGVALVSRKDGTPIPAALESLQGKTDCEKRIIAALQEKLNLRCDYETIGHAMAPITSLSGANMIMGPELRKSGEPKLSFHLHEMKAQTALMWLARVYHFKCRLQDDALFLYSDPEEPTTATHPTAQQKKQFDDALKALSSDEFDERERASKAIEKLGVAAAEPISDALTTANDPEVCARLEKIFDTLFHDNLWIESPLVTRIFEENRFKKQIALTMAGKPLSHVLEVLSTTENIRADTSVLGPDPSLVRSMPTVSISVEGMELRNVLRWVARLTRCRIKPKEDSNHLDFYAVEPILPVIRKR